MKIRMLMSLPATLDGLKVQSLEKGAEYDAPDSAIGARMVDGLERRKAAVRVAAAPSAALAPAKPKRKRVR